MLEHKRLRLLPVLCVAALALSACESPGAREDAAGRVALAFEAALKADDHAGACALLAPVTRDQLVRDEKSACAKALAAEDLPRARGMRAVEAYGREAMVRLSGDTLFLSLFTGGWKVVAAGCTPRPDEPYECLVKGA
ncbi:hypothetical protein ACFU3J_16035 [Streptomyces sp. NPDC057411]|uniref:hypothetical protein n=1 Tax=unclassified Streptomyces TaxID=2593676 RepID=UPI003636A044